MRKDFKNRGIKVFGGHRVCILMVIAWMACLGTYGLVAAVSRSASQSASPNRSCKLPMPPSSAAALLLSPWKMNRAQLVEELELYEIAIHPRWLVPELRQTVIEQREIRHPRETANPATGLSKLKLEELINKAKELDLVVPPKPTRGILLKMIREASQPPSEQVMTFGKYRSWLYKEVPEGYMEWSIKEVKANSNCSPDLRLFATWATQELAARKDRAKTSGRVLPAEDPEVKAVIDPPDLASVMSWTSSASVASAKRVAAPREKRQLRVEEDLARTSMEAELTEEDKAELEMLQTRLAAMKQKYHLPPRGDPQ